MSQKAVIGFIMNNPNVWFTTQELAKRLNVGSASISRNLRGLKIFNKIQINKFFPHPSMKNRVCLAVKYIKGDKK